MLWKYLSYVRYPVALLIAVLVTVFYALHVVLVGTLIGSEKKAVQRIFYRWGKALLFLFNIHLEIDGLENIPDGGAIFLFNHASDFDIPIICASLQKVSRFGAKVELFRIPVISLAMRTTGTLPIARGDRDEVLRLYELSTPRLHRGESFILAPEGTRQIEPAIGKFKSGPFIFAINAGVPVVPIIIEGAIDIMSKKSFLIMWGHWRKTVRVRFLAPIATNAYTQETMPELQEIVRDKMVSSYQTLRELSNRQA